MTEEQIMIKRYELEILKAKVQIKEIELQIEELNLQKTQYQEGVSRANGETQDRTLKTISND